MDAFALRNQVIREYAEFVRSFVAIQDGRIRGKVEEEMASGLLWPEPLVQLNPSFEPGPPTSELIAEGTLHPTCLKIFRRKEKPDKDDGPLRFHRHQVDAIRAATRRKNFVLTTGTGSGKSLAYIVPIVDHVLRNGSGRGIQAIIVYPMNALANSQLLELSKYLNLGFPEGQPPVTFRRYTGQESREERREIQRRPPDILLTNYVMLELILTRSEDHPLVEGAEGLQFLVLDELHTYRGRQGADVAMLVRRTREACRAKDLLHVGTSATLGGTGTWEEQRSAVASVASDIFGAEVFPENVIGETLRRATANVDFEDAVGLSALRERVERATPPTDPAALLSDPLASWIETNVGLHREPDTGRLVRQRPRPVSGNGGLASALGSAMGVDEPRSGNGLLALQADVANILGLDGAKGGFALGNELVHPEGATEAAHPLPRFDLRVLKLYKNYSLHHPGIRVGTMPGRKAWSSRRGDLRRGGGKTPHRGPVEEQPDPLEEEDALAQEQGLLYGVRTRARDELCCVGTELPPATWTGSPMMRDPQNGPVCWAGLLPPTKSASSSSMHPGD